MNSVGIDLHRKPFACRGRRRARRAVALAADRQRPGDVSGAARRPRRGETQIALEATYGWEWLAELLEDAGYELHLAHPLRTKAIASARVKTDAVDARTLAQLLRADLLPEAYVAPRELRDLRDLLRQRVVLTQMRSALKNRVHALLARQGISHQHADLFGTAAACSSPSSSCATQPRQRLDSLLRLIGDFDREIDALPARSTSAPSTTTASRCSARSAASGATSRC